LQRASDDRGLWWVNRWTGVRNITPEFDDIDHIVCDIHNKQNVLFQDDDIGVQGRNSLVTVLSNKDQFQTSLGMNMENSNIFAQFILGELEMLMLLVD